MTDLAREIEEAVVVDFESDPIRDRPGFPPRPCGVAIKYGAAPAAYYAWGHRDHANPHTLDEGRAALRAAWACGRPILLFSGKFDLAVASEREELALPLPPWDRVHDALPLLFLLDPRAQDYKLKSSSERLLGWKPEERDAIVDWLMTNRHALHDPTLGREVNLSRAPKSPTYAGAYVAWAPPEIAGPYACGDVDRTRALGLWAAERVVAFDMVAAYDRERRILPIIMRMERAGIRVDVDALARDVEAADVALFEIDCWLRWRLGFAAGNGINIDSGDELAAALVACGAATRAGLGTTAKSGKLQTNKEAFARGIVDRQLAAVLRYRAALQTAVRTFMAPWLATAGRAGSGGRIFTNWNSTRVSREAGHRDAGARTGRFSSNPNFQNIIKAYPEMFGSATRPDLPAAPLALPDLPLVRRYIVPEPGHVIVGRDFSSQELRVLAHCEDDVIAAAYRDDPGLDLHQYVTDTLHARGHAHLTRRIVKNLHFAVIYGVGINHLAEMIGCLPDEARTILDAYYREFPSVRALANDIKNRWRSGLPVRTWGGRLYFPELPRMVDGRLRRFDYKATNVVVQGGSADLTKEAMIAYGETPGAPPLLLTVHDELVVSAPEDSWEVALWQLRDAMNVDRLDVPMRSEGYVGPSFGAVRKFKKNATAAGGGEVEPDRPPGGQYGPWIDNTGKVGTNTPPPYP